MYSLSARHTISILCLAIMSCTSYAETDFLQLEDEATQKTITEILEEPTLTIRRVVGNLVFNKSMITRQEADTHPLFHRVLRKRLEHKRSYILIVISEKDRKRTLGGGTAYLLYDKDSYELLGFYRTR